MRKILLILLLINVCAIKAQDTIIYKKDTVFGKIYDLTQYGVHYYDRDINSKSRANWGLRTILYGNNDGDKVIMNNGVTKSGSVIKINEKYLYFGKSGKKYSKTIGINYIKSIEYANGVIDSLPPFIAIPGLNSYYKSFIRKSEKIKKQQKNFIEYSSVLQGTTRLLIGYNALNEVHIGYGRNFKNNRSFEIQLGYVFPIRDYIMYQNGISVGQYLVKRLIQNGAEVRIVYNYQKEMRKTSLKIERSIGFEYQYLESRNIYQIRPTGYHSTEFGSIYNTLSHNFAITYGRNYYLNKFIIGFFKFGFSLDFVKRYYTYDGLINLDTGEKLNESCNYCGEGDIYHTEHDVVPFPFIRIGLNVYFRR